MSQTGPDHFNRRLFCAAGSHALALSAFPAAAARAAAPIDGTAVLAALAPLAEPEILAGSAKATVAGVALLANPTLAALRRAVAARASLILSPESPFYARPAETAASGPFAAMTARAVAALHDSPAYRAKHAFVAEHGLTIVRLTPRPGAPDTSAEALAARLGWGAHRRSGAAAVYSPPGLTVAGLVETAHRTLGAAGGLRFIGDPAMPLRSVLVVPGTAEVIATTQALRDADALLTGDLREWEVVTYVHDSIAAGMPKALVTTGRIVSEQPLVAGWAQELRDRLPHVPLHAPPAEDPFWRVQA